MLNNFDKEDIIENAKTSRLIDKKTANYWSLYYGIPKSKIPHYNDLPVLENIYDPFFKFLNISK